jgi:hypothetical protein
LQVLLEDGPKRFLYLDPAGIDRKYCLTRRIMVLEDKKPLGSVNVDPNLVMDQTSNTAQSADVPCISRLAHSLHATVHFPFENCDTCDTRVSWRS